MLKCIVTRSKQLFPVKNHKNYSRLMTLSLESEIMENDNNIRLFSDFIGKDQLCR